MMRTIQMTLDEELVEAVDRAVKDLNTSRSAFARHALQEALDRVNTRQMEARHRNGYEKRPVTKEEFSDLGSEQNWGDE